MSAAMLVAVVGFACLLFSPPVQSQAQGFFGLGQDEPEQQFEVVDPTYYSVRFSQTGLTPDEASTIEGFSSLIADQEEPVSGSLGVMAKARSDRDNLIGALYSQAYYGGVVTIRIEGTPLDQLPPTAEFDRSGTVDVAISIDAGPKFSFGSVRITGDTAGFSPEAVGLASGAPAGSEVVFQAEDAIIAQLRRQGHPFAKIADRRIEADHDSRTLDVLIEVAAGPTASLAAPTITGNAAVETGFIVEQSRIVPGRLYSPEELSEARRHLLDLEVFEVVTVTPGNALDAAGMVPVEIEVKERKMRYFGVGATYSNDSSDGFGIEGYWGHRNLFGRAEKLRIEGAISRIGETGDLGELNYSSAILFEKPGIFGPTTSFTASARALSENTDAFVKRSVRGRSGIKFKPDDRNEFSAAIDLDRSEIEEPPGGDVTSHLILSTPLEYAYDGSDEKLDPKGGYRFAALLEPAHDIETSASFVTGKAEVRGYYTPIEDGVTFAARLAVGSITGADLEDIPADRRFYAGGGGSIRGYAYQAAGPKDQDGTPTGGLSIFETSVEARIPVTDSLGIVAFIDAGNAYESEAPDPGDLRVGVGGGIRYQTPFGPLRLDVGVPLDPEDDDDDFGIYAGIGQAF